MGPHGPSRYGFCLRDASVSDTAPIRTREGLPRAPMPAPRSSPGEHNPGGVRMQNGYAGDVGNFSRRGLLQCPSGMRGGILLGSKLQPSAVRCTRAQERNGEGRRINRLEPTDRARRSPYRERTPDRSPRASVASIVPGGAASRQGTPAVAGAPPLRRRAIFCVFSRRPFRGPTGDWNHHERFASPRAIPIELFGLANRITEEGGVSR